MTSPKLKYSVSVNGDMPLSGNNTGYGSLGYVWQDKIDFNLDHDPLTVQKAYGLLDLTMGVRIGEKLDFAVFGRNLLDQEYMLSKEAAVGALGRMFVRPPRDGKRYFGIKASMSF